jgi:hypothetical protein
MTDHKHLPDPERFTMTLVISFVVVFVFCMLMMLWHGSFEKDANGKMNYNTRVNEPSTSY